MRILLTGSTGRLGGAFLSLWPTMGPGYEVTVVTRQSLDLSTPETLKSRLQALWSESPFEVIINPAAVSGLEECLDQPELAQRVNTEAPRAMAEFCEEKGVKLVHFSTDYVFSGEVEGMKSEEDAVGAINQYGKSKQRGEWEVMQANKSALVCRVSWLFGPTDPYRPTHFDMVLDRAVAGEEQRLIGDKYSVPTSTYDIVSWVETLLKNRSEGIYHLCNAGGPESWLSYGQQICKMAQGYGYDLSRGRLVETSMADATFFREKRPIHTAMVPGRLISEGLVEPRAWQEAAKEYVEMR